MKLSRLVPVLCLVLGALADKPEPKISSKKFDAPPHNLFFFDDSEVAIIVDRDAGVIHRSTNAGAEWEAVDGITKGQPFEVLRHPHDNKVAVALGRRRTHWITDDQGETWRSFKSEENPSLEEPLGWHATDSKRILFHGDEYCDFFTCLGKTWYTEDGFKTMDVLINKRTSCIWAKTKELFTTGNKERDDKMTLCITESRTSHLTRDYRLIMSDNYYKEDTVEPKMSDGRTIAGMTNMAPVKGFIVAAAKSAGTSELGLYVTKDTVTWHRAQFGDHKVEEDGYTILESTNYSMQVDVRPSRRAYMGVLFTSNSNGTYFTRNVEYTNRNKYGIVDFEKIQNIQGIALVNIVHNHDEIMTHPFAEKQLKSQISFDDGRTFHDLRTGKDGKETLHLHSMTKQHNSGRVFSSAAPGIVMGVGNTGKFLDKYEEGDLYISDDAGFTWTQALKEAHVYEFGDQGSILVAVYDEGPTDQIMYSIDHGRTWTAAKLDFKIRVYELTTIPDSTSLKFIMIGAKGEGRGTEHYVFSLDFAGLHEQKCKTDDFEKWYARTNEKGDPTCLMGHKQWFERRKPDADCFIDEEFKDPVPATEQCECSDEDFECDANFVRSEDRQDCVPAGKLEPPEGECKGPEDKFKGSSGWRLIPGNDCKRKKGSQKDDLIERPCSDTVNPPASGKITSEITKFRGDHFNEYFYLERQDSAHGDDETVVVKTSLRHAYISHDHGKNWERAVKDEVVAIYPHQYSSDHVYFITPSDKVYYSENRGKSIHSFKAPEAPNDKGLQIIGFHESNPDWLLWIGGKDCSGRNKKNCHTVAHVSTKAGEDWKTLLRYVQKCQFLYRKEGLQVAEELVYCEQHAKEDIDNPLQLISSEDWFEHKDVHFEDVANFATMSEFLVVAAKTEDGKWLKLDASVDYKNFAPALFPPNFQVGAHQSAYTVLDSSTNSVFLHVTVNNVREQEYGSILKSNSNGTSYVLSINDVNRDTRGFVDFEKMQGIEGVAVINVVANRKEVDGGANKKKQTMITHNDGAEWAFLTPPEKDVDGSAYHCAGKPIEECSLHIHGYTERSDPRDAYSSASAVGLMLGVGNVGDHLGQYKEGDTFMTTDAGVTWKNVMKGTFMWEYGDQGSIVVLVKERVPTSEVKYSRDEGKTWETYVFSESPMQLEEISTVPSDNSRNFLLWGKDSTGSLVTVNLDFTGLTDTQCKLDEEHPDAADSDYYLWRPKHPLQQNDCLFGHVAEYHRKKLESNCFNGPMIHKLHNVAENCTCIRQDFECDFNFERAKDGSCQLIKGFKPKEASAICTEDKNAYEYFDITGYRRIPISTCQGGNDLAAIKSHPCPGHEKEYQEKKGISGWALFLAIVLPIGAAAGAGYWVWRNWDGKFGRIRLGDASPSIDRDSPWIQYPIAAVSAIVAMVAALPLLAASLWRSVSSRVGGGSGGYGGRTYTSRSSFARGRGDYAVVDPDEGELLGEDSDEEV